MSVSSDSTPSCRRGGRSMRPDSVFKRSLALVRSRLAPPLSRRSPSRPRNFLWPMLVVAYVIAVGVGTVFPWPIAASRLAGVGNGPYVPLTYTSLSSDTREYRSQIYLVPSRTAESWSLYRVSEANKMVSVDEIPLGTAYAACIAVAVVASTLASLRRRESTPRRAS